jgi:CheY-like chemotaxis protein
MELTMSLKARQPRPKTARKFLRCRRPQSVLIVDDSQVQRKLIAKAFSRKGWEVDTACNGIEALELMMTHRYAAVIMDFNMPLLDGFAATRYLREWESTTVDVGATEELRQAIVGFSADGNEEHQMLAKDSGIDCMLKKPFAVKIHTGAMQKTVTRFDLLRHSCLPPRSWSLTMS